MGRRWRVEAGFQVAVSGHLKLGHLANWTGEGARLGLFSWWPGTNCGYRKKKCLAVTGIAPPLTRAPGGGAESAPSFFQNNSKTVADIDTNLGVPYSTLIWHQMTKFGRNQLENFWEIDVLVGSLPINFDQNRIHVKKFAKNRVLKETVQKDQNTFKVTRSTEWRSRNFKILNFWPPKLRKLIFRENL